MRLETWGQKAFSFKRGIVRLRMIPQVCEDREEKRRLLNGMAIQTT